MTFSEMKQAKKILLDNGYTTAADIVPALTDTDLQAILAGDFSGLDQMEGKQDQRKPQAQTDHGTERRTDHQTKHQGERITHTTGQQDHHGERVAGSAETGTGSPTGDGGTVQPRDHGNGDILEDDMTGGGLLPVGLYDDIADIITGFCKSHSIPDQFKIHPQQWGAICFNIGYMIKRRQLLNDWEKLKHSGGRAYDPQKVLALLSLYEYICNAYKQTAFSHNFPHFAGVSREYFNDYMKQGLTSARVNLSQKAADIQRASIVGAISAGGSATVGNIFLGKALAGLQETTTVMHVSASPAISSTELPSLPSKS
jgi:hypothetical protein